jgi:CubicO group peptidase (beta-lactamase class C family)
VRVDLFDLALLAERPFKRVCPVPDDLDAVSDRGAEELAPDLGADPDRVESVWEAARDLYRTGLHPAIQLCIRRSGRVVLNRAIGRARGGGPDDFPGEAAVPVDVETPFLLYSASKAIAAMAIHKLDELGGIHLDDRICDYIPEFAVHRKQWITIRHVLSHRAGIPMVPREAIDLDLLAQPAAIIDLLCQLEPLHGAGRRVAYHAISGGFLLGEIVQRVTGADLRQLLRKEVLDPLGFRWMNFGVSEADVPLVARDAATGLPVPPPFSWALERALGTPFREVVELASDPRFLTAVVPSANVVSTAQELCAFYQCLLDGGELDGVRVFDERTVRHATSEQTFWELDLTLFLPLRYGLGFMLGGDPVGLFGWKTRHAFGHLGFTNIFSWADPERELAVALLTSGKSFVSVDAVRLLGLLHRIGQAFPPIER